MAANVSRKGKGVCAIVVNEYEALEENEIHLVEGELIEEIEKVDENWWSGVGDNGAKRGLFPSNSVEETSEAADSGSGSSLGSGSGSSPEPQDQVMKAIALYDYNADEDNEVSFREGELIVEIEHVSDHWWQGRTADGSVGLFPENYVELSTVGPGGTVYASSD